MVDPISVVAAVDACYSIAKEIYKYVERFVRFEAEVGDLNLRFEDHNTVLSRFVDFFRKEEIWINENDRSYFRRLFVKIEEDLRKIERKIRQDLKGKIFDRFKWPIVSKYLIAAEHELGYWVQALNIKFAMLPDDVKQSMIDMVTSATYQRHKKPLSGLMASVRMQQAKGEDVSEAELLKLKKKGAPDTTSGGDLSIYRRDSIKRKESDKMDKITELEVARLVHVLQKADSSKIHIPAADYYYARSDPVSFGIVYKWPEDVVKGKQLTLKEVVHQQQPFQHVRIFCLYSQHPLVLIARSRSTIA
jgi:hypothetical protein